MAVCKLAVLSFADNTDYGGYSIGDLHDCIGMARYNKESGLDHIAYVKVDIDSFIKWAKHKIKIWVVFSQTANKRGREHND